MPLHLQDVLVAFHLTALDLECTGLAGKGSNGWLKLEGEGAAELQLLIEVALSPSICIQTAYIC